MHRQAGRPAENQQGEHARTMSGPEQWDKHMAQYMDIHKNPYNSPKQILLHILLFFVITLAVHYFMKLKWNRSAKWILHCKKVGYFNHLCWQQNNNKTGFNDPEPDFIQKECHGWRAKLPQSVMWPFIIALIAFIVKSLALLKNTAENTYPEFDMPQSASKRHNRRCVNVPLAGLNWKLLSCVCMCDNVHCVHSWIWLRENVRE